MTKWTITKVVKKLPKLRKPVLIEGLPGIGNVGKIAIDFMIEELHAKKLIEIFSYSFPHSVFVNEDNLVDLPTVAMYYARSKGGADILFLGGDVQPVDEVSSYEFSDKVLDIFTELGGSELVTLGGIGLPSIPKQPKVYCTGNSKEIVKRYTKGNSVDSKLYGVVGPIVGASGVLLGLAKQRKIAAAALLAETYGHPMYLGMRGARELVRVLNTKFSLRLSISSMDKEIGDIEAEMGSRQEGKKDEKRSALDKIRSRMGQDTSYIG